MIFKFIVNRYLAQLKILNNSSDKDKTVKNRIQRVCNMCDFIYYVKQGWKKTLYLYLSQNVKLFFKQLWQFIISGLKLIRWIFIVCWMCILFPFKLFQLLGMKYIYSKIKNTQQCKFFQDRVKFAQIVDDEE